MVARTSPAMVISNALKTWPEPAKAAIADNPTTIRAKYSDEWNSSATEARAGAKNSRRMAPSVPPAKEEIAAMVSALPAFPCLVSG